MPDRRVVAVAIVIAWSRAASAQTSGVPTVGIEQFWESLYRPATQDVRANGGPSLLPGSYGSANALHGLLVAQIINLPTGSNAGGLSWSYDPALGTWSRTVDSFGPHTAERAQTVGRRKANFGFAYERFTFDRLDGHSISVESAGTLSGSGTPPLTLRERVSLSRADVSVSTTFGNYGITSRIDVGVFLPVVSLAVDGSLDYTLRRGVNGVVLSQRANTVATRTQRLGDPQFRGKWNVIRRSWGGVAVAADLRVHTRNQLGADGKKLQFIASGHAPVVNTHVNAGVSQSNCNGESAQMCGDINALFLAAGIDKAVTKRVTLATDVQLQRVDIHTKQNTQTLPTSTIAPLTSDLPLAARAETATLSLTGKFNVWGNVLVTLTGLVPANSSGLIDRFTPIIGLDYAW